MPALAYIPESRSVSRGALGDYLNQTERCSGGQLLSADQELELARAIANGDTHARDTLIKANVKLVIRIATQYRGRGLSIEDLVGAAMFKADIYCADCVPFSYNETLGYRVNTLTGEKA